MTSAANRELLGRAASALRCADDRTTSVRAAVHALRSLGHEPPHDIDLVAVEAHTYADELEAALDAVGRYMDGGATERMLEGLIIRAAAFAERHGGA